MQSRGIKSTFLSIIAGVVCALPVLAADSPVLTQAVQDYNGRKYKDALTKLDGLSRTGQASDKAHYYMALCYQGINQMNTAKSEYMWVYSRSKDATLKYNAWQAIQSMERWSQHRAYEGQGNSFSRTSPGNSSGEQFRQQRAAANAKADAEEATATRRGGSGGG
jgi:hypothetical protein